MFCYTTNPVSIYLFKVNNENTRAICQNGSKLNYFRSVQQIRRFARLVPLFLQFKKHEKHP